MRVVVDGASGLIGCAVSARARVTRWLASAGTLREWPSRSCPCPVRGSSASNSWLPLLRGVGAPIQPIGRVISHAFLVPMGGGKAGLARLRA